MSLFMKRSKIIFLDVDGVIYINESFNNTALTNLQTIVQYTGAVIVLSSNWRLYKQHRISIMRILNRLGIPIVGQTASFQDCRPQEIYHWICEYRPHMCIVLDDRDLCNEGGGDRIQNFFLKTHPDVGIDSNTVSNAIRLLNQYKISNICECISIQHTSNSILGWGQPRRNTVTMPPIRSKNKVFRNNCFVTFS